MDGWKKALLVAGGTAGAAAVLYCLLRDESKAKLLAAPAARGVSGDDKKKAPKLQVEHVTKEQVQQILMEIVESQDKMRTHMKILTQELQAKSLAFEGIYKRVRDVQPQDPLERYGLSMMDFDTLLNKYQDDPQVREGIAKIMGIPDVGKGQDKGSSVASGRVVEVHSFMLEELDKLVRHFSMVPNKESYDMKIVTLAAQAVIGAKVEEKFSLTSEDIERAVLKNHETLAKDQEFAKINMKMQQTMAQLMGESPP
mmetsp:Transcript_14336/g.37046  ORF Transcript_14336/g.37046 Transcript_14336/m.37046 type:complete len:255 (-) Transcript_14336:70-834(-)